MNWSIGDFDGDGLDDVFRYIPGVSGAQMFLSGITGFTAAGSWSDAWNGGRPWHVGDFDGDGKDDVFRLVTGGPGAEVLPSSGTGFGKPVSWSGPIDTALRTQVGDFNGDGKADILREQPGGWGAEVLLSDGSRFIEAGKWTDFGAGADGWYVGDFNGDGRSDLLRYMPGMAGAEVLLSNAGTFEPSGVWTSIAHIGQWTVADLNTDGLDDLIDGAGHVLLSDGGKFKFAGSYSLMPDEQFLGVIGAHPANGVIVAIASADTGAISDIAQRQLDVTGLDASLVNFSIDDAPRLAYVGQTVDFDIAGLGDRYEARLVVVTGADTVQSDWSRGSSLTFAPETIGDYSFTVQIREIGSDAIALEKFGGRMASVLEHGAGLIAASFERLRLDKITSDISDVASSREWRAGVENFRALFNHVEAKYQESLATDGEASKLSEALYITQFVSGMWAYGNAKRPDLPGEVTDNEIAGATPLDLIDADLFINSVIGGCEDFAALLGYMLTQAGFENRVVINSSHVFNEALIEGKWWTLDSTFGLAIDQEFDTALGGETTPTVLSFTQTGRSSDGDVYRQRLVEGGSEHLSLIAYGRFPDAQRYETAIDYLNTLAYGSVFIDELDLADWAPSDPVALVDGGSSGASTLDEFLRMTSLSRLAISEQRGIVSGAASASDWRVGIASFGELRDRVDQALLDSKATPSELDQALFYLQWVSGLWGYGADSETDGTVAALLGLEGASAEDRAAILGWLASGAGLDNRIQVEDDTVINEILIEAQWWSLDATTGLAFKEEWADVIDTAHDTQVLAFHVAGQSSASPFYSERLAELYYETLAKVANGSFGGRMVVAIEDWLLTQEYGQSLHDEIDPAPPMLLSILPAAQEFAPLGVETLSFTVDFSKRVMEVGAADFTVTGATGAISSVTDNRDGTYTVEVSGGDLGQVKASVSLGWQPVNNITDLAGHPMAPSDDIATASYWIGVTPSFTVPGSWGEIAASGWTTGDFNGDGKTDVFRYVPGRSGADMVLSDGEKFAAAGSWTDGWNGGTPWYSGDFNGDGKDDIFRYLPGQSGADMFLSDGGEFVSAGSWTDAWNGGQRWYVGDFNGDGKDDIFRHLYGQSQADVFLSTGSEFVLAGSWTSADHDTTRWVVGDFDGDGKDDIFRYLPGSARADMFLSTGADFVTAASWLTDTLDGRDRYVGDFNGDGKDDILSYAPGEWGARVLLSTGAGFSDSGNWTPAGYGHSGWMIGDFNSDGSSDIMRSWAGQAQVLISDWNFA